MAHIPQFIRDLALILGAAGVITLLFKRLKQPVVLGYILAGLLVGPNFHLFPTISDVDDIRIWADIGVIFLLFALGLEFSFKKLIKVGGSAGITGIVEIACMFCLGYITGKFLNWPPFDCIFLGGIIAISSTTIIFRALDELGLKSQKFATLVLGVLVIEDLVAILLLVLLSTVAVSRQFEGMQMLFSIFKLLFFLSLWFITGVFILPTFMKKTSRWLSSETLLIVSLALCLGMALLADGVGFSTALGAFLMGSLLAETTQAERIEHLVSSVKDLFGAIFFVSVGMLINPALLKQYMWPVLLLIVLVVVGKTVFVSLGALLAGQPLKQSVQAGTSMSQIGEFSFIIATLGVSLKVTSDYLYPIAVGVSVMTTFTTPFMMKLAEPLYRFIEKILPAKWVASLNRYSSNTQTLQSESDWQKVVRSYLQLMLSNAVIIIACILLASYYVEPFFERQFGNILVARISAVVLTLAITSPFIWALTARKMRGLAYKELWLDSKYNHGALLLLELARNFVAIICWGFLLNRFFSFYISVIGTLIVMPVVLLLFRRKLEKFYGRIQTRFLDNLNKKDQRQNAPTFWDAHLAEFIVSPYAAYAGRTLQDLGWREKYAINIAYILRADKTIPTPSRYDKLFPYDKIGVVATDQQLQAIKGVVENDDFVSVGATDEEKEHIGLMSIVIDEHTRLKGLSIRESAIREKTNGLIVGVERNNQRVLNPSSDTIFEWGDVVWLVGDKRKIRENYVR